MTFFNYLLQVSGCLIAFYALYFLWFRKELFFQWMRAYLVSSIVVAFLLPLMPQFIPSATVSATPAVLPLLSLPKDMITIENPDPTALTPSFFTLENGLLVIYLLGMLYFLGRLLLNLLRIWTMIQCGQVIPCDGYQLVKHPTRVTCSFFRYIFWSDLSHLEQQEQQQILQHELVHVRDYHSIDTLLVEIVKVVLWFSPIVYVYE